MTTEEITLDELGTSRLFALLYRNSLCYIPEYKSYFHYHNGLWEQDKGELLTRRSAKHLVDAMAENIPAPPEEGRDKWKKERDYYNTYRNLRARVSLIEDSKDELVAKAEQFDKNPFLFNCKNGTFNLQSQRLQQHNPEDKISKMANVNYDPDAKSERFLRFIQEICEGDAQRANMLQKALGYALKGEANEECYFTAIGATTRNGKGTLFDSILNLLGSYGAQIDFNSLCRSNIAKDGSRATPDLARLIGTRFVLANEPEKGICVNEALLKQITGNDDIVARPLYAEPIQFKPVFKLFITANTKPMVADDSLFASGRIKLLPFPHFFSPQEQDSSLKARFRSEEAKSAILNWLLAGYELYLQEGLYDTPEMQDLTEKYRHENDYIRLYLEECVQLDTTQTISLKQLRLHYAAWCEQVGTKPFGLKAFKEELTRHGAQICMQRNMLMLHALLY